jgi:hypothetical protein
VEYWDLFPDNTSGKGFINMSRITTKTGSVAYARYQLKRAILESALENNYTEEDRQAALKFFGGCAFCGEEAAIRNDHLIPVMQYGDFVPHNVVPACQKCDDSKGQKEYHEWMRNSNSPKSLRRRHHFSKQQIEQRIKKIEKWQSGYKARTEKELFGSYYGRYKEIMKEMNDLCNEANELLNNVRS